MCHGKFGVSQHFLEQQHREELAWTKRKHQQLLDALAIGPGGINVVTSLTLPERGSFGPTQIMVSTVYEPKVEASHEDFQIAAHDVARQLWLSDECPEEVRDRIRLLGIKLPTRRQR
jgi:hypothetical protein